MKTSTLIERASSVDEWSMLRSLGDVGEGYYNCNPKSWVKRVFNMRRGGWLSVERKRPGGDSEIMWTSHRHEHDPFVGPAMSLTIARSGELKYYMESALTMHIKWDKYERRDREAERYRADLFARWAYMKLVLEKIVVEEK